MYAVEFRSDVENGTIRIPDRYRNKLPSTVKVIILSEEEETTPGTRRSFSAVSVDTRGFRFDRDAANER